MRSFDSGPDEPMTDAPGTDASIRVRDAEHQPAPDRETRALVRLAAIIASGTETDVRRAMVAAAGESSGIDPLWVEELILQSYLFVGFPRALNGAREWRRASNRKGPRSDEGMRIDTADDWRRRGERTCAIVYGEMYERLRVNIRELHPALDAWMITEGYGKVLSRPGLDLVRRELCIVAVCAVLVQDRQLHSHLHGAVNAGASRAAVEGTLDAISDLLAEEHKRRIGQLWAHVRRR